MSNDFQAKISLPGYDIDTCTPEQMAVDSDHPSPKIEESKMDVVSYTFSSNPASGTTTNILAINHGYSYIPMAIVYVKAVASGRYSILPFQIVPLTEYFITYTTSTQLKVDYVCVDNTNDVTGLVFDFKYYIFVEDGI